MHTPAELRSNWHHRCGGMAPMIGVVEWKDAGSLGRTRLKRQGGGVTLCVSDQLQCMGMDEKPTESQG